jgi:Cu/Ag efflux protein CusF
MPAMTMDLPVKNSPIPKELAAGDDVQFELTVTEADSWISPVVKIVDSSGASDGSIPGTSSVESATRE